MPGRTFPPMPTDALTSPEYIDGRKSAGELRSRRTRENIKRSALRLWVEHGVDLTTIEEICADAGVGRTTFYLHFKSTDQLLAEMAWSTAEGALKDLDRLDGDVGLRDRIETFISGAAKRVERLPRPLASRILAATLSGPPDTKGLSEGRPDFAQIVAHEFRLAQTRGELADDVDPDELGAILQALMLDAMAKWAHGSIRKSSLRQMIVNRLDLLLYGVLKQT